MARRYCLRCSSEVEDVGGFCLLGHPLKLDPAIPSVAHIRDRVNQARDAVRAVGISGAHSSGAFVEIVDDSSGPPADSGTPARLETRWNNVEDNSPTGPPPPPVDDEDRRTVWEVLDEELDAGPGDPLETFAPPPRMDWGPTERSGLPALASRLKDRRAKGAPAPPAGPRLGRVQET